MHAPKLFFAAALLLHAAAGRSQSICSSCPTLQGLPDTLLACKQTTLTLMASPITNVGANTYFYDTLWTATPTSAATISNPFGASPTNLTTSITLGSQAVKIKLRVRTIRPTIAANGDFTLGNNGSFTSGHTYNATSVASSGSYAVATNPSTVNPTYSSFGDHTTGTGNMLVVNGATTANTTVWCQNFAADACADYQIGYWAASATSVSPAVLRLRINGTVIPTTQLNLSPITGTWLSSTYIYSSTATGSVEVCLMNSTTAGSGNDFVLDDIAIRPMCRLEDSSYIPVTNLRPLILYTTGQGCTGNVINFKGDTQNNPGVPATLPDAWLWNFGDGSTGTGFTPVHAYQQQGTYDVRLRVYRTTTYNGLSVTCVDSALTQVYVPASSPVAAITGPSAVCVGASVTLSNATPGGTWSHADQSKTTVSANGVVTGVVPGIDTVLYTATVGGCTGIARKAVAVAPSPVPPITSNGTTLSTGTFTTYSWARNGTPVPGATGTTFTPTASGSYTVTVTNAAGCSGTSAAFAFVPAGLADPAPETGITVYPNPATTAVSISGRSPIGDVQVSTAEGRLVRARRGAGALDLSGLPAGVYAISVYGPAGQLLACQKLVKLL